MVPTARGDVEVRLERDGDGFVAQVRTPAGVPTQLRAAPGLKAAGAAKATGVGAWEARFIRAG